MTNEGLKFAALALGVALVIVIIVLIVGGHKDKYEAGGPGPRSGARECCSLHSLIKCSETPPPDICKCEPCEPADGARE